MTVTSFSIPNGSLGFWTRRLNDRAVPIASRSTRFGEDSIVVSDPSGLFIELVEARDDGRAPWRAAGISDEVAIRGLHSVTMTIRDAEKSAQFMREWLSYSVLAEEGNRVRVGVGGGGPGKQIDLLVDAEAPGAVNGIGTVHHVAMAIPDASGQIRMREELVARGIQVTPIMDRQYFQSIYFREPGGVLFEVATMQPGFTVDEPLAQLGRGLKLPPWEEPHRTDIERGLAAVTY